MKGIMMYTGNEKLEYKGKELPYSMLQFWQLSLSDILFNMNRGDLRRVYCTVRINRRRIYPSGRIERKHPPMGYNGTGHTVSITCGKNRSKVNGNYSIEFT